MKLEKLKNLIYEPISFYIISGLVLLGIIGYLDSKWLEWSNKSDVLVEAHGLLFDILLFGILFLIFNKVIEKRQDIKRYQENIDDLKGWHETEATFKIVGNLKRLIKLKAKDINLANCYLHSGYMSGLNLQIVEFSSSVLDEAIFQFSYLTKSILSKSSISFTNFNYCDLSNAIFKEVEGNEAKFKGAKMNKIDLEGATIEEGDFSFVELNPTWAEYDELKAELLTKSYLTEPDLANNLVKVDMSDATMSYGTFDKSNFEKAILKGGILNGAFFREANMDNVDFTKADLRGTTFDSAILSNAIFDTVTLHNTSFKKANLKNATLRNSNFKECDFEDAIFAKEDKEHLKSLGIDVSKVKLE